MTDEKQLHQVKIILAFAAIYIVWGIASMTVSINCIPFRGKALAK